MSAPAISAHPQPKQTSAAIAVAGGHRPGVLVMVSSMQVGGAEKHAVSLVNRLDTSRFRIGLCDVKPVGNLAREVDSARLDAAFSLNVRGKLAWSAVNELARRIDQHEIDVIVCTNGYPLLYALIASRKAQRPVRLVEVFHTTGFGPRFASRLRMLLNRFLFRRCELVVYVSHKQREYWRAHGVRGKRDIVIQNGIDADYFTDRYTPQQKAAARAEFGFLPSDFVIGICAALRPEKAHGDLLRAVRRLHDSGLRAKVLIIGDGPQRGAIERQIAELKLTGHAVIAGHRDDVRPYIACCDVMTLTSHAVETFSIAALESMALGKPMVLTRIGGAEEQIRHGTNGFLYERGDIAALARLLGRMSAATDRLSMGAVAAREVRERFTVQHMIERFTQELLRVTEAQANRN
ncbi:MAG TPA: glycosyltransferase [Steroidobacteraceae bacterium]|nr:glycosyltransferase [Steroidobacteraceae bacterium]